MRRTQSVPPLYNPHAYAWNEKGPMKSLEGFFFIRDSARSKKRMLVQFKADKHNLNVYLVQRFLREKHQFRLCQLTLNNKLVVSQNEEDNQSFFIAAWFKGRAWNEIFCTPLDLKADLWLVFLRTCGVRFVLESRMNYHRMIYILRSTSLPSITESVDSGLPQDSDIVDVNNSLCLERM